MIAVRCIAARSAFCVLLCVAPHSARAEDESKTSQAVTSATSAPGMPTDPAHLAAARELARLQFSDEMLSEIHGQAAEAAALSFENSIQPSLGRALTAGEKERLLRFWRKEM